MEVQLMNSSEKLTLNDAIFSVDFNEGLVHQVVTSYMTNARSGTKAQKTRSEVRGGGAKPWRQKGTGRARAGTIRSPIWRSGGVTFAAKPKQYSKKVNKKVYLKSIQCIFSELLRREKLSFIEPITCSEMKTKQFISENADILADGKAKLVIVEHFDDKVYLASRNIPNLVLIEVEDINPYILLAYDAVYVEKGALPQIEERF